MRSGYFYNGLRAERLHLEQKIRKGEARSRSLHDMQHSVADDHDACIDVYRRMLEVVKQAEQQ